MKHDGSLALLHARALRLLHEQNPQTAQLLLRRPEVVLSPLVMTPEELGELRNRERRIVREIDCDGSSCESRECARERRRRNAAGGRGRASSRAPAFAAQCLYATQRTTSAARVNPIP